jgi:glycosyltransferase involved in cell wall biosynthesis
MKHIDDKHPDDKTCVNALLVDFDPGQDWQFLAALRGATGEEWQMRMNKTDHLHGSLLKNLRRCVEYILYPLMVLCGRRKYRRIVGWQQFYGLNLAFWQRLLCLPKRFDLTVMTFIYKPKRGAVGRLYYHYMKFAVASRYIDRIVCYSRSECSNYSRLFGVPESKFVFMPLGVAEDVEAEASVDNTASVDDSAYVFAAGRSNRDYPLLLQAMRLLPDRSLKVACEESFASAPSNVEVLHGCYGGEMFRRLSRCYCVVVPLQDPTISAGQLSLLQAMQYGKPIIVSRSAGVQDYVTDGETALLVEPTAEAWRDAIARLYADRALYERMSRNCRQTYLQNYTEHAMGENFAALLR